ncbi:MAG: hypothetical protein WDZ83_19130 [Rhizobiaceae bacterium]
MLNILANQRCDEGRFAGTGLSDGKQMKMPIRLPDAKYLSVLAAKGGAKVCDLIAMEHTDIVCLPNYEP